MGRTCFASSHWTPGVSSCLKWLRPWAEQKAGQAEGFELGARAGETITTRAWVIGLGCLCCTQEIQSASLRISGAARPAGPGLMLGFPSPLQFRPFYLVFPRLCCLVGEGEQSKHGLCPLASLPGGLGLRGLQCF